MGVRRWRYCRAVLARVLVAWLLLLIPAAPTSAQGNISVTVYHVPESEACRPAGYRDSLPTEGRVCQELDYRDDVEEGWRANPGVPRQPFTLQPGGCNALRLQTPLRGLIHQYTTSFKNLSEADHRASVFVFDFGGPMQGQVSLTRIRPSQELRWEGLLEGEQYWIVHHEAHWLHWFNKITWTLRLNTQTWSFRMD